MHAPKSTTTGANGAPTGEDDAGGGESEPANDPNKTSLSSNPGPITLNNPIQPADNHSSLPGSAKSPKSPRSPNGTTRPQISVHIQPATPKSSVTLQPGSAIDYMQSKSAGGYSAHPNSHAHDAVQSWVQSQGAESAAAAASNGPSKRDSVPPTSPYVRNRRPSESSHKSGKEKDAKDIPRPPSASGSASGGGFSLKDLLSSGPKLSRRNSASSKKSVSSGKSGKSGKAGSAKGGSKAGSAAGDSALESKYGIHGKVTVGKGATSIVRLAHKWDRSEEDRLYAVKEFRPRRTKETERDYVKKLTSEFCISSSLRHPNVVETVDLMQDQDGKWCEVMEFCPGGDLYAAIRKGGMSPAEVECSFKQILTGVGYLHQQGVAHRDIKPENLFFDARGQVKIGDFGASTVFRLPWESTTHKSSGLCGSEPYIAPEQFTLQQSYDARLVDVWACGIVYYCLHFSELPWSSAQTSDKTYAQYAQQCASPALSIAGIPFLKHVAPPSVPTTPGASGPGTPARQSSSLATPTTASLQMTASGGSTSGLSRKETERELHKESTAPYPTTIQHLSPRACRPVLRRMLEPKPDLRVGIDDVLRHPWIQQIEVCTEPGVVPKHIHPTPVATAAAGGIVVEK